MVAKTDVEQVTQEDIERLNPPELNVNFEFHGFHAYAEVEPIEPAKDPMIKSMDPFAIPRPLLDEITRSKEDATSFLFGEMVATDMTVAMVSYGPIEFINLMNQDPRFRNLLAKYNYSPMIDYDDIYQCPYRHAVINTIPVYVAEVNASIGNTHAKELMRYYHKAIREGIKYKKMNPGFDEEFFEEVDYVVLMQRDAVMIDGKMHDRADIIFNDKKFFYKIQSELTTDYCQMAFDEDIRIREDDQLIRFDDEDDDENYSPDMARNLLAYLGNSTEDVTDLIVDYYKTLLEILLDDNKTEMPYPLYIRTPKAFSDFESLAEPQIKKFLDMVINSTYESFNQIKIELCTGCTEEDIYMNRAKSLGEKLALRMMCLLKNYQYIDLKIEKNRVDQKSLTLDMSDTSRVAEENGVSSHYIVIYNEFPEAEFNKYLDEDFEI